MITGFGKDRAGGVLRGGGAECGTIVHIARIVGRTGNDDQFARRRRV